MIHHADPPRHLRREFHRAHGAMPRCTAELDDGRCYLLLVTTAGRVAKLSIDDELVEDLSDALATVKSRRDGLVT